MDKPKSLFSLLMQPALAAFPDPIDWAYLGGFVALIMAPFVGGFLGEHYWAKHRDPKWYRITNPNGESITIYLRDISEEAAKEQEARLEEFLARDPTAPRERKSKRRRSLFSTSKA